MIRASLDWLEVDCLLDALQALVEKHQAALAVDNLDEDEQADLSNDLSYAQMLRGKYEDLRDVLRGV